MSFSISLPADATTIAPMRKIGTIRISPVRMPHSSASAPTIGRRTRPGRIQSAETAKPNERIFGGMASDRAAKIGGTISTTMPVTSALRMTAITRFGLSAKSVQAIADRDRDAGDEPGDERRALHEQAGDDRAW